ncbi:hypothetical protein EGH21_22325 [Halomicroarcula sp. F13]|uniref:Uncharacterized protein n=1 Tax=Haloarcula rubra TaxID=2487747 RepID=A0AAW4PX81_9EURY|nr:hypothetical protein [Halomicroarcula rubra]MBX0325757.1 hypothetical protein [Halomicroarcula rubra]
MATDGADPRAPHWFDFNKVNDLPNEWRFEVLEWDDDPDGKAVDRGGAEITDGEHRLVIVTWLVERDRTHDRYYSVAYETINQDGEFEPLAFHLGRSASIARNSTGHARDCLEADDGKPHVLVRHHDRGDGERETFEFPNESLAEQASDLQVRLKLDHDDRDYLVNVFPKDEWEERLETERELESGLGGGRGV